MLVNSTTSTIRLDKTHPKVLKLCPTAHDNYLMIVTTNLFDQQKLVHVNSKGTTLWQRSYKEAVDTFGFLSDNQVIVMNVAKGQIEIIELSGDYNIRSHPHELTFPDTSNLQIITFYDTRYVCFQETGLIGDGKLILTYYLYSASSFEMVSQFRSKEGEYTYGESVAKINNHSKVAWWPTYFSEQITFSYWDLGTKAAGQFNHVKVRNNLTNTLGLNEVHLSIADIAEMQPGVFMLFGHSNATNSAVYRQQYVLDKASSIVRRAKFNLALPAKSSVNHILNLGEFTAFHSQNYRNKENGPAEIVYIDNKQERVVFKGSWQASMKSHFYLPGYDPNAIIEAIHSNGDVSEVTVKAKRLMTVREMYLHMLIALNEDFDDDLLFDALETLGLI